MLQFFLSGGSTYTLTAATGAYALSGVAPALQVGHVLAAATGIYTITGIGPGLNKGKVIAATGVYHISGVNPGMIAPNRFRKRRGGGGAGRRKLTSAGIGRRQFA